MIRPYHTPVDRSNDFTDTRSRKNLFFFKRDFWIQYHSHFILFISHISAAAYQQPHSHSRKSSRKCQTCLTFTFWYRGGSDLIQSSNTHFTELAFMEEFQAISNPIWSLPIWRHVGDSATMETSSLVWKKILALAQSAVFGGNHSITMTVKHGGGGIILSVIFGHLIASLTN